MTQAADQPDALQGGDDFEPKIVAFCCHYCAYTAADTAGASRMQYPPNIRIVRLPCSGRIDVPMMLKAFTSGADGVYVVGCLDGDCHFILGNAHAKRRVPEAKKLLAEIGIEPERLEMFQLSAAMGARFAEVATEMTDRIKNLGPTPVKRG
ncbi:MAG: hydrogenase iron-sulfur subunit [Phycisphaerae bacterium]|jgi:coenzyme F420-reducing hydrogenase delta subunit|nr:hydrogenase iron-sulfur subunit [Phycisphaerae bacterium]MDP7286493.1 hydrogenase iron-sulfur subunit [Phycisphaerae bacterium]